MVEFALLLPFLLTLTVGIVEMSNIYFLRSMLNEVVRDAARRAAVGALDKAETEKFVLRRLAETAGTSGKVSVNESEGEGEEVDVTVLLSVPARDLLVFGSLTENLFASKGDASTLDFSATMLKY